MITISPAIAWLVAGVVVLGLEIFLGTAFLLAVSFAFAAAALAAALGAVFNWQLVVCAVALAAGCAAILAWRRRSAGREDASEALQHLDAGQWVSVTTVGSDGLALVQYRGAPWIARSESGEALSSGRWTIARVDGAQLVLGRRLGA